MPAPAPLADLGLRWRIRPWLEFHWRDWGSDSVVFELRSGQTYQVDVLTAALMACLDEGPLSITELARAITADLRAADEPGDIGAAVREAMRKLVELRWIEAVPSP